MKIKDLKKIFSNPNALRKERKKWTIKKVGDLCPECGKCKISMVHLGGSEGSFLACELCGWEEDRSLLRDE